MMVPKYWIFVVGLGLVAAMSPVPYQTNEESLRGALNAVTRKQRSLNTNPQAYYGDLPLFKYREDNGDRKLQRQQVGSEEIDDNEESLAFIPSDGTGQLETIGDGYQHLNNKQLSRALMDYLKYTTDQEVPPQTVFRERDGNVNNKRGPLIDRNRISDKELARLLLDDSENDIEDDPGQLDEIDYQRALELIYDKYKNQPDKSAYGLSGGDRLLLRELFGDENGEEDQDPRYVQYQPGERRNVNARYPIFNRDYKSYRDISKRFPISKRSAKDIKKKQATDPKVAQDLGALFGTQSTNTINHTHNHALDQDHSRDHNHNHDHDHPHDHGHELNHNHVKGEAPHPEHAPDSNEKQNATEKSKALNDNLTKVNKTKERTIEVKKKSVDWSQYFGIDRRKKKTAYAGRPETQDQDEEYLLQKYYELMAENLNPANRDSSERQDKLQQMDSKLKNMKNAMIEDALQVSIKNGMNSQDVKDEIMSRLSAAYSLEKLRRTLIELSRPSGTEQGNQKANQAQNNLTSDHAGEAHANKISDKRNNNNMDEMQGIDDESSCLQIDLIERHCKATEALIGDYRQLLYVPCVLFHICSACEQENCLERFMLEAEKACQDKYTADSSWSKYCLKAAMLIPRHSTPVSRSPLCRLDESEVCLAHQQNRYRHRYLYDGPYPPSSHHRPVYDLSTSKR